MAFKLAEEFYARHANYGDRIMVKNLSVTLPIGLDAWGRSKSQPLQISVTVALRSAFSSASATDKLDGSTVHYGKLSKGILSQLDELTQERASSGGHTSLGEVARAVEQALSKLTTSEKVAFLEVDGFLPKGSICGEGTGHVQLTSYHGVGNVEDIVQTITYLRNLRMPAMIGVNSHERGMKQPVIINAWVDSATKSVTLEKAIVDAVDSAAFETLESLAEHVCCQIAATGAYQPRNGSARLCLRIEKPLAILQADAPAIEIVRTYDQLKAMLERR